MRRRLREGNDLPHSELVAKIQEMDDTPGAVERNEPLGKLSSLEKALANREEIGHELDVVDHGAEGPEDLVAVVEEPAAEAPEKRTEWRRQTSSQGPFEPREILVARRPRNHVPIPVAVEDVEDLDEGQAPAPGHAALSGALIRGPHRTGGVYGRSR